MVRTLASTVGALPKVHAVRYKIIVTHEGAFLLREKIIGAAYLETLSNYRGTPTAN